MTRDILLYGSIWEYNAMYFHEQIRQIQEEDAEAGLVLRINCNGGSPEFGWSIITKIQELENLSIIVDGQAHSMAAFMLCYVKSAESVDVAQFIFHRAAYPRWVEESVEFLGSVNSKSLERINKDLEKAFRAAADVEAFENLPQLKEKEITLKSIFSMEGRVEVMLSAADMKKIGLIKSIRKITPAKKAQIDEGLEALASCASLGQFRAAAEKLAGLDKETNNDIMTIDELRSKYPEIYAEAVKSARDEATETEKDRVVAWMEFIEIDADAVKKGIEGGKPMGMKDIAAFTKKGLNADALKKLEAESAGNIETGEDHGKPKTEKEKELEAFDKKVDAEIKNLKWI